MKKFQHCWSPWKNVLTTPGESTIGPPGKHPFDPHEQSNKYLIYAGDGFALNGQTNALGEEFFLEIFVLLIAESVHV